MIVAKTSSIPTRQRTFINMRAHDGNEHGMLHPILRDRPRFHEEEGDNDDGEDLKHSTQHIYSVKAKKLISYL